MSCEEKDIRRRRHSYKAAMRPAILRNLQTSTERPTQENTAYSAASSNASDEIERQREEDSTRVERSAERSISLAANTEVSQERHENEEPVDSSEEEPRVINRASIGSQFSTFQIILRNESISDVSSGSSSDEGETPRDGDGQAEPTDHWIDIQLQERVKTSQEKNASSSVSSSDLGDHLLRTKSDSALLKSFNEEGSESKRHHTLIGRLPISTTFSIEEVKIVDLDSTEAVDWHSTDQFPVIDDKGPQDWLQSGETNEGDDPAYCTIDECMTMKDEFCKLPTDDGQESIEETPQKKTSLTRKNAIRLINKNDKSSVRKNRSQSMITSSHSYPFGIGDEQSSPALPKRNKVPPKIPMPSSSPMQPSKVPKTLTSRDMPKAVEKKPVLKKYKLHNPKSTKKLRERLLTGRYDQMDRDQNQDTALHAILRAKREDKHELLLALMVYSDFGTEQIDIPAKDGSTALHIAIQNNDFHSTQILLSFGANINAVNYKRESALDILQNLRTSQDPSSTKDMWELLLSLDAESGTAVKPKHHIARRTTNIDRIKERINKPQTEGVSSTQLAHELEMNMNDILRNYEEIHDQDFQMSLGLQQFELKGWKVTGESQLRFQIRGGRRILFLDGGGIRGLIQIEILSMLEKKTGKQITELFDWIVGTSTGGLIALVLVFGNKTLAEIRQFYFKMKDDVFGKTRFGFASGTSATVALEDILKESLTVNAKMSDIQEPKVLVSAVNKTTTRPYLTFFNNCLGDEFSNEYVWKVARYTTAAPMYFSELDGYIDGGILANNPGDHGLTVIQNFYQRKAQRLDIACIVSVGSGIYPSKPVGNIDVHEMLGMKMLNVQDFQKRVKNLMTVLSTALVSGDDVVKNCKSRCDAQNIPFHRFSPTFQNLMVESDETNDTLLVQMLIETKILALLEWEEQFDELMSIFKQVEEESRTEIIRRLRERKNQRLVEDIHAFSQ